MEMFLDQAVNMDLVVCPTLFQVGMKGQAEEDREVKKKMQVNIFLNYLENQYHRLSLKILTQNLSPTFSTILLPEKKTGK